MVTSKQMHNKYINLFLFFASYILSVEELRELLVSLFDVHLFTDMHDDTAEWSKSATALKIIYQHVFANNNLRTANAAVRSEISYRKWYLHYV